MSSTALLASAAPVGAARVHLMATVSGVAFGLTAPLTVVYATALGAGGVVAGAAVSSMSVSILLVDLLGSRFVPRLEPRRALAVALVVFGVGSLISALAPNLAVMIAARCFQGVGAALFQGTGPMLAVRVAGRGNEGRALGRFQAAWFLGIAIGPLAGAGLAGTAAGTLGLRIAFASCAAVSLLGAVVVLRLLPRMPTGMRPVIGLPRLGGLAAPRPLLALTIGGLGQSIRSGLAMTLLPLVVTGHLGLSGLVLGLVLSMFAVSDVAAMYAGGHLADRIGRLPVLAGALVLGSVLVFVGSTINTPIPFAFICLGLGIPVGIAWVVPAAMAVDLADDPVSGLSGYRIAADLGLGLGGVLAGAAVVGLGTAGALEAAAAALLVPALLGLAVGETLRRREPIALPNDAADLASVPPLHPVALHAPTLHAPTGPGLTTRTATDSPHRPPEGRTAMTARPEPGPPTADDYHRSASDQGLEFQPERYPAALATHAALRPALLRLRQVPIPFLQGTEPASALAWIENGGAR